MVLLLEALVGALAAALVQKVNHESQIDMLVKFLETYNNFAANLKLFRGLLSNISLQIFEKGTNSVVLQTLEHTISQLFRV